MKKLLVLLPIAALAPLLMILLASAQPIPSGHYTGPVDGSGTITFDVSADGMQVVNLAAQAVTGTRPPGGTEPCTFFSQTFLNPLDITGGAFGPGIPGYFEISGSFSGPDTAAGTLRLVQEEIPGTPVKACDSGTVTWSATGEIPTPTPTPTPTPGNGGSESPTPTSTPTPTPTPTPSPTPSPTPTPTATPTPSPTPEGSPTPTPTASPTPTPTQAATPEFTLTPKATAGAATATPVAAPPTGSGGDGGIGGLGLVLIVMLAAALLAGTASLIAFSFRQQE